MKDSWVRAGGLPADIKGKRPEVRSRTSWKSTCHEAERRPHCLGLGGHETPSETQVSAAAEVGPEGHKVHSFQ